MLNCEWARYIIACEKTGKTAVVDPYDPKKLDEAASKEGLKLADYLLTTHSHHDQFSPHH